MKHMKVYEIKEMIKSSTREEKKRIISLLLNDERTSVKKIGENLTEKLKKEDKEIERINKMKEMEDDLRAEGYRLIAGIDEAGRGPLAGPVAAAAVILPSDLVIQGINDSKKLTHAKREILYEKIVEKAVGYGVGMVDNHEIDRINILQATYKAVRIALSKMDVDPDCLILDALTIPQCSLYQKSIIKGDQKCLAIAAASIIAKVERDRLMDEMHELFPHYNFLKNKGYGTQEHIDAIKKYGPSPIHRRTFIKKFV